MRIDNLGSDQYLNRAYNIPSQGNKIGAGQDVTSGLNRKPENTQNTQANQDAAVKEAPQVKRGNASLGNVALSLGNRDSSLIGLSNIGGISSNVMKTAVSQMQKDSILHEYQYFVGSGINNNFTANNSDSNILSNDEDGIVIKKS